LKEICGFEPFQKIPKDYIYSRFIKKLSHHYELVEKIFSHLVLEIQKELPDFGKNLSGDGKAVHSLASPNKNNHDLKLDGRRDIDADFGVKKYSDIDENGKKYKKSKSWFGYKFHIISDSKYELPVIFDVTKASLSEGKEMKKLLEKLNIINPDLLEKCEYACFDKGYDDEDLIKKLFDDYGVKPIIDIRNMWKDKDATRLLGNTNNIVYDYMGKISCYCMVNGEKKDMAYAGFEKDRNTLKYRCPVQAYGLSCKHHKNCNYKNGLRINISMDRRLFTPLPRSSYKWKSLYKTRTSIERLNGRFDEFFGFEKHYIRGLKKMKLKGCLAFITMLSMALGRIKTKQLDKLRSMVKVA